MLKEFKALVTPRTFVRGEQYYQENRVRRYKLNLVDTGEYLIRAVVEGSRDYKVEIRLSARKDTFQYNGFCTCPYDWEGVCKHQVAAMLYFLNKTFPTEPGPRFVSEFERLQQVMQKAEPQAIELSYQVKGMLMPKMVNFSFTLVAPALTSREIEQVIAYVSDPEQEDLLYSSRLFVRFTEKSLQVIEYLRNAKTRASKSTGTVLIGKTPPNFAFIYNLAGQAEVICQETGRSLYPGVKLQPAMEIRGTEDTISFHLLSDDYAMISNFNAREPLHWTIQDDHLHPLDLSGVNDLPQQVRIPEEEKGRFIFELLPGLQQRFNARISEDLQDYELQKIYPEISLTLDYHHGEIICDAVVKVGEQEYRGAETLSIPTREVPYRRSAENPKVWYGLDKDSFESFMHFLEENEFVISHGRYVIKDEVDQQNFITGGFLHLPEEWQVTVTDNFNELEIIPLELEPIIEISTDGKINWFDFQIRYNLGGETFTHQEIMARMRKNSQGDNFIQIGNKYYVIYDDTRARIVEETLGLAHRERGHYESEFFNLLYYRNRLIENGIQIQGDRIYNELEEDITGQKLLKHWEVPDEINDILRNYQKTGYSWMRFLHKYHLGGILADDMGLGKTVQVLTLIKALASPEPALVVCPKTLLYNWAAEIEKFFPDLHYLIYYGNPGERVALTDEFDAYDVIITTYSIIARDLNLLQEKPFAFCILDEAQQIKNFRTRRAESVKNLNAQHRLVLTGTPIENSLDELWSLFDFLMSGYLGSHTEFKRKYITPIREHNDQKLLTELKARVAPFILRRTKQEVLTELPEKTEQITRVEMTKLQQDIYETILAEVRNDILASVKEFGFKRSQITVLAALTRLRQVCNHPQLVLTDIEEEVTSGKVEALMDIVQEALAGGHKMLIFSQFVKMLKVIEGEFAKAGISYEYLDGSTKNRMERVNRFNSDPAIPVFLISLKAGGTGLNLTSADIVIHVDPWWNPMVENQATDRAHRIGQTNKVLVYKLITAGTVEEKMLKLQERKRSIFDAIIEQNAHVVEQLTWEDVQDLFSLNLV